MGSCDRWKGGAAALLAAAALLGGCKDRAATSPTAKPPPGMIVPTSQAATAPEGKPDLSNLENIAELGRPVAATGPDGTLWQMFSSGLMVEELKVGAGRSPELGQTVWIRYTATFLGSHEVFDRVAKDHPLKFVLGSRNVIKGWNQALSKMKVGACWRILVPPDLAYGDYGDPGKKIGPNQALLYEMELLSITGDAVKLPDEGATTRAMDRTMGPMIPPGTRPEK